MVSHQVKEKTDICLNVPVSSADKHRPPSPDSCLSHQGLLIHCLSSTMSSFSKDQRSSCPVWSILTSTYSTNLPPCVHSFSHVKNIRQRKSRSITAWAGLSFAARLSTLFKECGGFWPEDIYCFFTHYVEIKSLAGMVCISYIFLKSLFPHFYCNQSAQKKNICHFHLSKF